MKRRFDNVEKDPNQSLNDSQLREQRIRELNQHHNPLRDQINELIRNGVRKNPEQHRRLQEQIADFQTLFLAKEGKKSHDKIHRLHTDPESQFRLNDQKRENYKERYEITGVMPSFDIADEFPSATTLMARVKGYSQRACYIDTLDLESGTLWDHWAYKSRPIRNEPVLNGDLVSLLQRDEKNEAIEVYLMKQDYESCLGKYDDEAQPFL